jgi:hypothetical protein
VWLYIEIAVGLVLGLWLLSAVCAALLKIGIREYFKQKRIHYLEMLKYRAPEEQEHK